ncbi:MAG: ABC transporter ATP-binding protein [Lachnospiraceae bacterium]|jgi:ABC-2 type transport system ATP-binding protein|nr:ABC transporter ATP-binding protein [Lachnospiraceae bacterium]
MESMEEMILSTRELTKYYGERAVVAELDLDIRRGEIFGILGPDGAGKTTIILMLLGLIKPTRGSAFIDGMDCLRDSVGLRSRVGYLPDQAGFYLNMTGRENLRFTGRLNGFGGQDLEEWIEELLERVGMTGAGDQKVRTYSRGMKQRLGIADVLIKDPEVVIMDEPVLGINPESIRGLTELIRCLSEVDGRTVLILSHQPHQIQQLCHRVGIFVGGRLMAWGGIDELARQAQAESSDLDEIYRKYFEKGSENCE